MSELLIELFSEEIPARMQVKAAEDLRTFITNGLVDAGLTYDGARQHATPRRLVLSVEGLADKAADTVEERKGPKLDAPPAAIEGFVKSAGVPMDQMAVVDDPKKGKFYVATIKKEGRSTTEVVATLLPLVIRNFPWPKSMRWGSGSLKWVRPLHSIICTFDGEVVPLEVDGIVAGNTTRGHRFLSKGLITVKRFEDYDATLRKAHVVVDEKSRLESIRHDARNLAMAQGLDLIEDEGLLKEVAGLVEWPVVLMGEFAVGNLEVPEEVIITTIKNNQKCFCLRKSDGKLANKYIVVSNQVATDGGKEIIRGNNKVIAARLSDAKFFWDQDRKVKLEDLLPKLDAITFHAKLGTQGERVKRIEALAGEIAKTIGADVEKAKLAARLAKADLVSGMVGEFPELQGQMGRRIALEQGVDAKVADAIQYHYQPLGPKESLMPEGLGHAVAIADKLDTLLGFWLVDEKPTSSKDPFALRRAALGIIRIALNYNRRLDLPKLLNQHAPRIPITPPNLNEIIEDLLGFIGERLKVYLKDMGTPHDVLDSVLALGPIHDVYSTMRQVSAVHQFTLSDDGKNLLAGVKRASNILKIEEKKDGVNYKGDVNPSQLIKGEEKSLHTAITTAAAQARRAIEAEDFEAAMKAIAKLRLPVDAFFENVTVNDKDQTFRTNRLRLLNRIREATAEVADFSRIEG